MSVSGKKTLNSEEANEQLKNFLFLNQVKKGELYTHTRVSPKASYFIDKPLIDKFFTIYCNAVFRKIRPSLTEKPGMFNPLHLDFDLKASLDVGLERQYTIYLQDCISIAQNIIRESIIDEEFDEKYLQVLLLEKSSPRTDDGIVKDGFHLHFPHFIVPKWYHDIYFRPRYIKELENKKVFSRCRFLISIDKIIDGDLTNKVWMMYGSSKSEDKEPYLYTKAFDVNFNEIQLEEVFEIEMVGKSCSVKYYLPKFLSLQMYDSRDSATPLKSLVEDSHKSKTPRKQVQHERKRTSEEIYSDIKIIQDGNIMDMISSSRATAHNTRMEIGWILYNIGEGCDEALDLWINFCQRDLDEFVEGKCEDRWSNMKLRGKKLADLLKIAEYDNPEAFRKWKRSKIDFLIEASLEELKPKEYDVAKVIEFMYKDKFVCADDKKGVWYEFKNHRWNLYKSSLNLRIKFAEEVRDEYQKYRKYLIDQQDTITCPLAKAMLEEKIKRCSSVMSKLKESAFHTKLTNMCELRLYEPGFAAKLDQDKLLFGCENGVLDLHTQVFREGRPSDYITFSCKKYYNSHYTFDHEDVEQVDALLSKIFVDKPIYNYFLDSMCGCLEGGNPNKTFLIHTGKPDGAKSLTMEFIEKVFGDYCIKMPRDFFVLSGSNDSARARPEIVRTKGKRVVIGDELTQQQKFDIGVIKLFTGNDSYWARNLFDGEGENIRPQLTLMIQCNKPPQIPSNDEATWDRFRMIPYKSKFVKPRMLSSQNDENKDDRNVVPDTEEERLKKRTWHADLSLRDKLDDLAPAFLWILFNRYGDYKIRGMKEPQEVQLATRNLREENDVYMQFISEKLVKIEDKEEAGKYFIKATELYTEFGMWYKINYPSYVKDKVSGPAFREELSKYIGAYVKKGVSPGWFGYKLHFDMPEIKVVIDKQQLNKDVIPETQ